jgi:glutathione S-transferase
MPDKERRAARADMIEHGVGSAYFPSAVRAWAKTVAKMDAALAEHPWLAGETFSTADIGYAPYIVRLEHLGLAPLWADRRAFIGWLARLKARPSFSEGLERWLDPATVGLMQDKGQAAWPDIQPILAT